MKIVLKRILLGLVVFVLTFIVSGTLVVIIYGDKVKPFLIEQLNRHLTAKIVIDAKDIDFTFFKHFPNASVEFKNVTCFSTWDKSNKDTLFHAGDISMQFNIMDIYHKHYCIKQLDLSDIVIYIKVDEQGKDNFHFWKSTLGAGATANANANFSFALNKINLSTIRVDYSNLQNKISERATIKSGEFSGNISQATYELKSRLNIELDHLSINEINYAHNALIKTQLSIAIDQAQNSYALNEGVIVYDGIELSINGKIINGETTKLIDVQSEGENISIQQLFSLVPEKYSGRLQNYTGKGRMRYKGRIQGNFDNGNLPDLKVDFGIDNGSIKNNKTPIALSHLSMKGRFNTKNTPALTIESFAGNIGESTFKGSLNVNGFKKPTVDLICDATLHLKELQQFLKIDTIEDIAGSAKLHVDYKGLLPDTISLNNAQIKGSMGIENLNFKLKNNRLQYQVSGASLVFNNNDIEIEHLDGLIAKSDINVRGTLKNIIPYLLFNDKVLEIDGNIRSKKIDLNTLLTEEEGKQNKDTIYEFHLPEFIKLTIDCDVSSLCFRKFNCEHLSTKLQLRNKKLSISSIEFEAMQGFLKGNILAEEQNNNSIHIYSNMSLTHVNIATLLIETENFGQQVVTDKNVKGLLTSDIQFTTSYSTHLKANVNDLTASANVKIEKGELIDFDCLKACARFINLSDLEHIKFATLENQIEIKNQLITIPKMELKNSALNIKGYGTHSFNNDIDYHVQFLLRDLLAKKAVNSKNENEEFGEVEDDGLSRSLFIAIKGTVDNPVVKYDGKGMRKKIKEDIKKEKTNFKSLLHDEFGWFKKDSAEFKHTKKSEQVKTNHLKVKWDESDKSEKKKEEEKKQDEDF